MRAADTFRKFETCITKLPKAKQVKTDSYNKGTLYPIISQEEKLISGYCDDESMLFGIEKPVVIFGDHTRVLKYVDFDFIVGADGVKILSPIEDIDAKFLFYYLTWYNIPNLGYSRHYKLLKKIDVPIPKKETQYSIVKELDQINALIEIKEKQLRELEELEQTIFHEMFGDPIDNEKGWDVDKLGSVCDVRDGTHDSPKYLQQSNYMLITSKNISSGIIDFSNVNYISEEDYNSINKRSKVDDGDLIMPMVGTIGNPVIAKVDDSIHYAIKNVALIKFNQTSSLNNKFLHSLMNSYSFTNYMLSKNKGGTQKFVALGTIRSLPIIVPPLEMQNDYREKAKLVESQKGKLIETLNGLQELLASRMQYWFD